MKGRKQGPGQKRRWPHDPYGEREADRYESPMPSREYIRAVLEEEAVPSTSAV